MSNQSIDANKSANFIKSILDKVAYSYSGDIEFLSYQIHFINKKVTMLSHIVTNRYDSLYLHSISYKDGVFKVNTFDSGKGVISNVVANNADSFLKQVYLSGYTNGSFLDRGFTPPQGALANIVNGTYRGEDIDLFYAYSRRERVILSLHILLMQVVYLRLTTLNILLMLIISLYYLHRQVC